MLELVEVQEMTECRKIKQDLPLITSNKTSKELQGRGSIPAHCNLGYPSGLASLTEPQLIQKLIGGGY